MVQWITLIAVSYSCKVIFLYWCENSHCIRQRSYPIFWPYGHFNGYAPLWSFTIVSKVIFHDDLSQSCQRLCAMTTFHSHVKGYVPWWPVIVISKVMFHDDLSQSCQRLCSMMTFHSRVKGYVPWWPFSHVKGYIPWWPFTSMSNVPPI